MAPTATSSAPSAPPTIATIGISVSGIAVPTAARMLPVAPSPICSRWPAHSTAFVNSRAPARMIAKLAARRTTSIADYYPGSPLLALGVEEGDAEDRVERQQLHALEPGRFALLGDLVRDQHRQQDRRQLEAVEDERHRLRADHERC